MTEKNPLPSLYCSYLLRLWREDAASESPWRIVLIDLKTGDRRGFTDLEQLVSFLTVERPDEVDLIL